MQRFFISAPLAVGRLIALTGDQAHQVRRVLRMRPGDRAILLDGRGAAYESVLTAVSEAEVQFQAMQRCEMTGEPAVHITLRQAMLKGERFGWALQKGVEVGVSAFAPLICERNVVDDALAVEGKRTRWARIIQEAAEQCGRGRLPELLPVQRFGAAVQPAASAPHTAALRLLLWEGERRARLRDILRECNVGPGAGIQLFVGPEGGFSDAEVALAHDCGVRAVGLGPRILRAETAGVVAAALILYELGDI